MGQVLLLVHGLTAAAARWAEEQKRLQQEAIGALLWVEGIGANCGMYFSLFTAAARRAEEQKRLQQEAVGALLWLQEAEGIGATCGKYCSLFTASPQPQPAGSKKNGFNGSV